MHILYGKLVAALLLTQLAVGCVSNRHQSEVNQTTTISNGYYLLSGTNTPPGSTYEVGVYVIAKGDSLARIAHRFKIRSTDILATNPGLNSKRLRVGQQIRIYERRKSQDQIGS